MADPVSSRVSNELRRQALGHGKRNPGLGYDDASDQTATDDSRSMDVDGGRTRSTRQSALSLPAERVRATARLLKEKDEEAGVSILQMPGLILYPMWLLAFSGVCSLSHVFVEKHKHSGKDATRGSGENSCNFIQTLVHRHIKILPCSPPDSSDAQLRQDSMPRDSVQLGHQVACGFFLFLVLLQVLLMCGRDSTLPVLLCGVGGVLIGVTMLMQISRKKRILSSGVVFINLVAFTVHLGKANGWLALMAMSGRDVQISRYLEWMSTTPIMLFIIVSVTANGQGRHQKHGLVHNWRDTLAIVAWDEAMMIFGLLHATLMDRAYAWVLEWAACACLAMVFKGIWRAVRGGIQAAATTYEIHSMRVIEWLTYVLWTLMAVPHMLYSRDMISWQQFEVSSTVLDVVTKCVYSTTLLASNVCLLDVLETVRVDHLMADNSAKNSAVLRADMINQALHTSALEAEAEARLARRFLANVSHELRTPLNSVIAYTTLVVEDEPCEVNTHAEYCAASLTAAESLLGIINQVLEYAQIENELQLSSRLSLAQEPYSLLELFDQLPDIVGARVVERKIDLAIDLDEALLDGRGRQEGSVESARQVLIGDGFRVRQCLVNLVDNALKFAPAVGGEVLISVRLRDFRRSLEIGAGVASASCVMDEDPKKHFNVEYQPRVPYRDADDAITNDGRLASQRAAQEAGVSGNGVRWATLSVQVMDNGIGIHPDKMFLLFKPFSQVHSEMTRKALGGTGLGLAITKSIVESMDGQVGCASAGPGAGSTFSLDIPVQLAPDVVLQSFPTLAPLPQTQDTHVRLAIFRGASERVLRQTLQHWGVLPDLITDLSLAAVTPSAAELALISERMMEDSRADAAHKVVYLCDLSVLQGLLESWGEVNREAGMDMLASLSGMVFLHPGEQRQLQQVLACDDGHLPSGWQSLLRPWKHLVFNSKLAACLEHLTQQASNRPGARSRRQTTAHASASQTSKPEPGSPKQRMPSRCECEPPRSLRALAADGQERVVADMLAGRDETGERVCADRRRILLVDDHAPNQKIAMRMIEKVLGADAVDIDLASDGLEAFRMVSTLAPDKGCYDIVFMDVQMPLCDGLEATRRIREWEEANPHVAKHFICALTAHANKLDAEACMQAGMTKYMTKPLMLNELKNVLTEIGAFAPLSRV